MADYQDVAKYTLCNKCNRLTEDRYIYLTDDEPTCIHCMSVEDGMKFTRKAEVKTHKEISIDLWNKMVQYAGYVRNPTVSISAETKGNIDELLLMEAKFWGDKLASEVLEIGE